ncbi:ABC transporter permease [Calidifontibacillus oryziterrae]|uniref:ABC transporter permease n=1 Tax=Calidifontibacillus oryziterrae TaxID=1191699 RepID=UPI0002F8C8B3|nr:ABC transporter permease [Calidifontibacillus oryziterrae]
MKTNLHTIKVLVEKEILDSIRNRWFYTFLTIFMLLSLSIIYLGIFKSSGLGFESFNKTTASLLNLILFLIPMITLLLGGTSISGEKEQGTMNLMLSKPISATELIIGKYLGIATALIFSIMIGFGLMGMIVAFKVSVVDAKAYLYFVLLSALLSLAFLSISILISVLVSKRITAIIVSTIVWFFFILIYDLVVMAFASFFKGTSMAIFLLISILLNPADSIRILAIVKLGGQTIFGPSLVELTRMITNVSSEVIILTGIVAWIIVPLLLSVFFFKRSVLK